MKATKKIIIGAIALIALLITIAGALAVPTGSFDPNSNTVTVQKNLSQDFKYVITNNDLGNLTYTWSVDDVVKKTETKADMNFTSVFTMNGNDYATGNHNVVVTVTGSPYFYLPKTWTVTVQDPQPVSPLSITKVKVNGKTTGKLSMSDLNKVEVEVSNDHDKKMEPVTVTIRLLDEDGDEIVDEEEEISKLPAGDEDSVEIEFDLSKEDLDEEEYTLEIEAEGEADNKDYSDQETQKVEVDREKDDITITKVDLQDSQVVCSAPQTSLDVRIKNVGENDQNGAKITVKNGALGVDLQRANIDLDDYSGSDNEYKTSFALDLQDAKQGTYTLDVAAYSEDDDLMDSKEVELQIVCATETASQGESKSTEHYADKELAAELQKQLDQYKAAQETAQSTSNQSFRQSNAYVALLGVLVALMFFATVLSTTYLLVKKR